MSLSARTFSLDSWIWVFPDIFFLFLDLWSIWLIHDASWFNSKSMTNPWSCWRCRPKTQKTHSQCGCVEPKFTRARNSWPIHDHADDADQKQKNRTLHAVASNRVDTSGGRKIWIKLETSRIHDHRMDKLWEMRWYSPERAVPILTMIRQIPDNWIVIILWCWRRVRQHVRVRTREVTYWESTCTRTLWCHWVFATVCVRSHLISSFLFSFQSNNHTLIDLVSYLI